MNLFVWKTNVQYILKSILSETRLQAFLSIVKEVEYEGNFKFGTAQNIKAVVISKASKITVGAKNQLIGRKKWGMLFSRSYRFSGGS